MGKYKIANCNGPQLDLSLCRLLNRADVICQAHPRVVYAQTRYIVYQKTLNKFTDMHACGIGDTR